MNLERYTSEELSNELERRKITSIRDRLTKSMPRLVRKGKTIRKNKLVYVIKPLCHGNGGWCGQTIIKSKIPLKEALLCFPKSLDYYYDGLTDDQIRICLTPNANDSIAIFNYENITWEPLIK